MEHSLRCEAFSLLSLQRVLTGSPSVLVRWIALLRSLLFCHIGYDWRRRGLPHSLLFLVLESDSNWTNPWLSIHRGAPRSHSTARTIPSFLVKLCLRKSERRPHHTQTHYVGFEVSLARMIIRAMIVPSIFEFSHCMYKFDIATSQHNI